MPELYNFEIVPHVVTINSCGMEIEKFMLGGVSHHFHGLTRNGFPSLAKSKETLADCCVHQMTELKLTNNKAA